MTKLLPGGFDQLLPIVQVIVGLHLEYILQAARGALASGSDAPSEEQALESVIRLFGGRHVEADKRALEEYIRARTEEWWQSYPERRLFSDLVVRADLRKRLGGNGDDRRRPTREEGLRIARPLLAGIPDKITLDAVGEYESVARLLAALLLPPMGEPSSEELQRYTELAKSIPVFRDGVRYFYADHDNADATTFSPDIRWRRRSGIMPRLYRRKLKVKAENPVKPALLIRNLQVNFVVGLLERVGIPPLGTLVSGCRIVGEVLGLRENRVKRIWEMRFTVEMSKHSRAVAERLGLTETTEA